jgi:putative ABC transport system ATP-binding protein
VIEMLALKDVWRVYPVGETEIVALEDVDLIIGDGEFVSIVGPSGSGKSTLLQIIGLLDRPTRGSVELDGVDVAALSDADRTRMRLRAIGFVFQRFHLLHGLTAIENVALPLEAAGVPPNERYSRAAGLLHEVGLGDRLEHRPSQLSGGQRQRVAIARALANDPGLILADEPTGELHSDDTAAILGLLAQFQQRGHTIVVVTHDPVVARSARRRVEMRDGRLSEVA